MLHKFEPRRHGQLPCPQGGSYDGSQCQLTQTQNAASSWTCPSGGTLNGTTCVITNTQAATDNYACPQGGALDGATCHLTNLQPATVVYGCPAGSTLSGTMCLTTNTRVATPNYACPANYQLQGTTCVLSESTNATPILACPDGYVLNGTTCTETLSIAATEHFACATGYTLDGTTCTSTLAGTVAGYACSAGYTIAGTTCTVAATQTASAAYTCPGGGILTGTDCVTSTAPSSSSGLTCQTPTQVCSDSAPTSRLVDGVAVSHDCWGWTDNYQCAKLTPANNCASLQSQANCTFDHEACLDDGCYTKSEVYLCKTGTTAATAQAVTCTGDIYCIDGSCNQVTREASPDFQNALVAINAMGDADGQFDPNSLTIFGGEADGCHKPLFGLVNCCAGKVSGLLTVAVGAAALLSGGSALIGLATQFLTLFLCSSEELQLDVKDRMGVCHYVGEYCSEKLLFACTTLRHQYCCFQTKLARVIQEQGRAQINKSWGDPSAPNCGGFSIAEFSQLDLSKMDFTEVYADFTSAVSVPSSLQNTVTIQQKIQDFYAQHSGN
jgi:conjugal transfer mating pair stabilization protein TraN